MLNRIKRCLCRLAEPMEALKLKIREERKGHDCLRDYPVELQLPITYKCNFNCVMCGMKNLTHCDHFSVEQMKKILRDPLFKNIRNVGINGGEPFLRPDLAECIRAVCDTLPSLKGVSIISNGFFTERILSRLREIKVYCTSCGIKLSVSVSVDGVGEMQDFMRGTADAFLRADKTCREIMKNRDLYCDDFSVICTITKHNISRINEVEAWAEERGVHVNYNVATYNRRLDNEDRVKDFSVFADDHARMLAREFFYKLYRKTGREGYYALFLFLMYEKRYAPCPYMYNDGVTLTPDCQLEYCATHSDKLGDASGLSADSLFRYNQDYHSRLREEKCGTCSHYIYGLNYEGKKLLMKEKRKVRGIGILRRKRRLFYL